MDRDPDDQPDDDIEKRDQQPRHRVALDEFRRAVERAEEGRLRLFTLTPGLGLGMVDGARVHVAVDGKLLAGHPVQRKARADLGHPARALGDDDEVHDQEDAENHQPDEDRA